LLITLVSLSGIKERSALLRIFAGAIAIVTGAASGIGRALAEVLVRRQANVVLADRQRELVVKVADELSRHGQATAIELDVRDAAAVDRLVQDCLHKWGRLDYLFNNAGIGIGGEVRHYTIDDWDDVFRVNVFGVVNGIQAAYPVMLQQGFGHIVNTASTGGLMPAPLAVGYCASKHAVVGLSTSLRIEAAPAGVRVSVLCPGIVRTPALENCGVFGRLVQPIPLAVQQRGFEKMRPISPEQFAEQALRGVARNKAIVIVPKTWALPWFLHRISPRFSSYFGSRLLKDFNEQLLKNGSR
jgi:NAD(P)-dependent dehydrogenase (short-subunit alcohol dehydrogenase family)